jgi:hypothetical protein
VENWDCRDRETKNADIALSAESLFSDGCLRFKPAVHGIHQTGTTGFPYSSFPARQDWLKTGKRETETRYAREILRQDFIPGLPAA